MIGVEISPEARARYRASRVVTHETVAAAALEGVTMIDGHRHPEDARGQCFPNCDWQQCSCEGYCANSFGAIKIPENLARSNKRPPIYPDVERVHRETEAVRIALLSDAERSPLAAKLDEVLALVKAEYLRASAKYKPCGSRHEIYGVIAEEWHEIMLALHANDDTQLRIEAVQLAAMALKFHIDLD